MAIAGKLSNHPDNETGTELLIRINSIDSNNKQKTKKKNRGEIITPFDLPHGWEWVQLEELADNNSTSFADGPFGSNLKKEHYTVEKQVRIIQLSNVGDDGWRNDNEKYTTFEHLESIKRSEVKAGDIVIAKMMPAGRAIVVPDGVATAFVLSSDCVKFVPHPFLNVKYLCYAINSSWFHNQVIKDVHGIGRERTSLSKLKQYFVPLPSLTEQQEIVDIISETNELIDTIDELQAQYSNNLSILKSKLIDLAIRGKLTEQLPEDGSAEDLYQKIQEEKQRLIKAGKINKVKAMPEIKENEVPFEIPENWKWVIVGSVAEVAGGTTPKSSDISSSGNIPYFKVSDMNVQGNEELMANACNYVTEKYTGKIFPAGTTIFPKNGGAALTNKRRVLVTPSAVDLNTGGCFPIITEMTDWIRLYMNTVDFGKIDTGSNIPTVNATNLRKQPIPLPPLAEQERIVEKLNTIISIIDKTS